MKRIIFGLSLLLVIGSSVWAQEKKYEITAQGSGFFTRETTDQGVTNKPTYSGGFLLGARYNWTNRFAFEADFDYFRNAQKNGTTNSNRYVKTNVYGGTGDFVVKLPAAKTIKPYALIGGGALVFSPHDSKNLDSQTRGTFVYGGGADIPLLKRIALRGEYRGFMYKIPDFNNREGFTPNKFTHTAVPSVGLVYTF